MITGGGTGLIQWFATAQDTIPGSGSSQAPAVIAITLALVSGAATLFSMFRQNRNDRIANAAVHSTAANEASKQSFEQMMRTVEFQAQQIADQQKSIRDLETRVEELQDQVDDLESNLRHEKRESRRLRNLVIQLGGTP